ncbi:sensor histidine kinase [Granulosicoccus sp. 3-233]|uniref:sensor histidine kinase n=1 Tax=Granulosicoccus sp. 3-233 TaxID=3417969 RepID=UPI003D349443
MGTQTHQGNRQLGAGYLLLLPIIIAGLILVQYAFTASVKQRTQELRYNLDNTYSLALELTQALGYGGLIHNFKNYLLRPAELQYLDEGLASADQATELVGKLEINAHELGIEATLTETRAMIAGYRARLERVRPLINSGLTLMEIDDQLRLDDSFALREISQLLSDLTAAVTGQIEDIDRQGLVLGLVSLAGTIILSVFILTLYIQRRNRIAHLQSIAGLNARLAESNANLSDANTSLKQFAGIVSHDLKSPLRHINLFNEQILEDIDDKNLVREHAAMVKQSVQRMTGMVSSLLDFTKTGFKEPERSMIDISELIHQTVEELRPRIDETQATVSVEAAGQVFADAQLLRRVIYNILENSLKYVAEGDTPAIRIETKQLHELPERRIQVIISDNGIGIAPEFRERVFEPMHRLHSKQIPYAGNGIGLSLAKTVIHAHGGDIEISDSYQKGTRICFTLPCDEQIDDVQGF